jgi:hypothetical protein
MYRKILLSTVACPSSQSYRLRDRNQRRIRIHKNSPTIFGVYAILRCAWNTLDTLVSCAEDAISGWLMEFTRAVSCSPRRHPIAFKAPQYMCVFVEGYWSYLSYPSSRNLSTLKSNCGFDIPTVFFPLYNICTHTYNGISTYIHSKNCIYLKNK